MAKELPYFKFFCDEYLTGDITMEDYQIQGIFINVCSQYWKQNCNTTLGKLKKRYKDVKEEQWEVLFKEGMVKHGENDQVIINFLDEQWNVLQEEHENKVKAGKLSAKKRWGKGNKDVTEDNTPITHLITQSNNKDKEVDKEVDKSKKPPPSLNEFIEYAISKKPDINKEAVKFKYEAWVENGWKDGHDNKIKNWKSKLLNTLPHIAAMNNCRDNIPRSAGMNKFIAQDDGTR